MNSIKKNARIAGFLYLGLILSGIFSLLYVPSKLIIWESAIETQKNITANIFLFKMGLLSDLIMYTAFMFLSLALYKLLKRVNKDTAVVMVILVLVSASISYVNLIPKFDVISLIGETTSLDSISLGQQAEHLLSLLRSHNNGISMIQIFWGLWLFPFGYLVLKSDFLPNFFGILLMVGCFGYITDFIGYFLFPESYDETIVPILASLPHAVGEIGICLWLLIVGVKEKVNNKM